MALATFKATLNIDLEAGDDPAEALADYLACNDVATAFELVEIVED
jgi:hypothetical protein